MKTLTIVVLLFLSVGLEAAALPADTAAVGRVFRARPGTNTLMAARDAVRNWRTQGNSGSPATVLLTPGDYALTEPLVLAAEDSNVIWRAADAGKVLVSGGRRIIGFKAGESGIWRATVDFSFAQLYVDDRRAVRARLPGDGFFNLAGVQQDELPNDKARLTVKLTPEQMAGLPQDPDLLQQIELVVYHNWDTSRYRLSARDAAAGTVSVMGRRMQPWNPWNERSRFIFDNVEDPAALAAGRWFLDRQGGLFYRPLPGERTDKIMMVAPALSRLIEIQGASNVQFEGIRFCHSAYLLPPEGCPPAQAAAGIGAAIQIDDASNVAFANCEIAHTGGYGVWFRRGCRDGRVEHCVLDDLGAGGIRIGETTISDDPAARTERIVADDNLIRGCGRVHPCAVAMWIGQSANNRVTHNDIGDTYYTAISVGWTWGYGRSLATNNFIGFNRIHQIGQGVLSDMGGVYVLGVSPGSACVGNVIDGVRAHDYGGWGIYTDEGSSDWRIESNLVCHCSCVMPQNGGAFHQHYGATNFIANNIFEGDAGPPMWATRVEDHLSFTLERNVIISSNAAFFNGPWNKLQFQSRNNCFGYAGSPRQLFPDGDLAAWQKSGHDAGSCVTNLDIKGSWPDIRLPADSPAFATGFRMFDTKAAGIYGSDMRKQLARLTAAESASRVESR